MSSESNTPGRFGRLGTQTTATHATDPNPADASASRSRHGETGDGRPVSGTRTRLVALRAEVELLEAEREAFANRVLALEADVAELEDEVVALERTVECEERRRQRVIDRYEGIVAEREETNRQLRAAATDEPRLQRVPPAIRSVVETAYAWLRHLVPNG